MGDLFLFELISREGCEGSEGHEDVEYFSGRQQKGLSRNWLSGTDVFVMDLEPGAKAWQAGFSHGCTCLTHTRSFLFE
ncbi:MAG: hypothetical protein ACXWKG_19985 [Limisphaerales bacterium]